MAEDNQTEEPAFGLLFEQSLNLDRGTGANMPASTEEGVEREIMASEFNDISGAQDPIMAAADAAEKRVQAQPAAPQFKTFGEAFKHHRKSGDKTFEWKGKTFTTALKSERAAQPKAAAKPTPNKAAAVADKPAVANVVATAADAAPAPKADAPAPAAPTEKPKRLLQFWGENVGETRSPYTEATQRIKDTVDPAKAGQRIMDRNKHGAQLM